MICSAHGTAVETSYGTLPMGQALHSIPQDRHHGLLPMGQLLKHQVAHFQTSVPLSRYRHHMQER